MGAVIGYDIPPEEPKQPKINLLEAHLDEFGSLIAITDEGEYTINAVDLEKELNKHFLYEIHKVRNNVTFDLLDEDGLMIERQELDIINLILNNYEITSD